MYTFILTIALTMFILFCFNKKVFWSEKYIMLFVSALAAFVVTLIVSYSLRGTFEKETKIDSFCEIPVGYVYLPDVAKAGLKITNCGITPTSQDVPFSIINDWDISSSEYKYSHFSAPTKTDSALVYIHKKVNTPPIPFHVILSCDSTKLYANYFYLNGTDIEKSRNLVSDMVFINGKKIKKAYVAELSIEYVVNSHWVNDLIGYPTYDDLKCIILPEKEYNSLPKECKTKVPTNYNLSALWKRMS